MNKLIAIAIVFLSGCAPPSITEILKGEIECDVSITMPDEVPERREVVTVKARFANCRESR